MADTPEPLSEYEQARNEKIARNRAFFALPTDVKRRVKRTATNSRGFADDEFTKRKERRPVVLWCLHAIDARRLQERRSWVVSFRF